jgi:hypothetical protein
MSNCCNSVDIWKIIADSQNKKNQVDWLQTKWHDWYNLYKKKKLEFAVEKKLKTHYEKIK